MSDPEKQLSSHDLQSEEGQFLPLFPLGFHKSREGEPLYPHPSITSTTEGEKRTIWRRWYEWSDKQPDEYVLAGERFLYEYWYKHPEYYPLKELQAYTQRWNELLQGVRNNGDGDIVDKHWSHLSWYKLLPNK